MTEPADVRQAVAQALLGQTVAGERVFTPLDWETWDGELPVLLVRSPSFDMASLGRAQPQFTNTTTVRVVGRLECMADTADKGALQAERLLDGLLSQVLRAVINYPPLMAALQQHPFVRGTAGFSSEGEQHLAELTLDIGCEFYQGPEDFRPLAAADFKDVRVNDPAVFSSQQLAGVDLPGLEADIPLPPS